MTRHLPDRLLLFAFALVTLTFGASVLSATDYTTGIEQGLSSSLHSSISIIVNRDNPLNEVSLVDLRRTLLGDVTRWPDGKKITIAMREPGEPERDAVLRLVCRMTEADFTRYLLHAAYRGEAQSGIKQLETSTGIRRFVFNVPGAIGYVRSDEVDQTVKVLRVLGPVPEAPAFGLMLRTR
jgi:ABC-type phosphate transport system substrate-binding protein